MWPCTARPPGACGVAGAAAWPAAGAGAQSPGQRTGQRLHSAQQRRGACPAEAWPASSPEGHCRQTGESDGAAVAHRGSQRWHVQHLTDIYQDCVRVAGTGWQAEHRDSTPIEAEARPRLGASWGVCQGVGQNGGACRSQQWLRSLLCMHMAAGSIPRTVPSLSASVLPACVRRAARRCLHRSERTVMAALVKSRQSQQGSLSGPHLRCCESSIRGELQVLS